MIKFLAHLILSAVAVHSAAVKPVTFYVYRAESSTSKYANHLLNTNAANEAGVMSYIHNKVIPVDQQSGSCCGCKRNANIDMIVRFQVTVLNPPSHPSPPVGDYVAYSNGVCLTPNCTQKYLKDGYFIGSQDQSVNVTAYSNAVGYSFPEEGLCWSPDGKPSCTYYYQPAGTLMLDSLVNYYEQEIFPDYHAWCVAGGVEFERDVNNKCGEKKTVPFWEGVCNQTMCDARVSLLAMPGIFNTSLPNGCNGSTSAVFVSNGTCVDKCPNGSVPDWNYACSSCQSVSPSSHCATCSWVLSPTNNNTNCLSCSTDYPYNSKRGCVTECESNEYLEPSTNECIPCHSNCRSCFGRSPSQCISCSSSFPYTQHNSTCVDVCEAGTYSNSSTMECDDCVKPCETCKSIEMCTSCNKTSNLPYLELTNHTCLARCQTDEYVDEADSECRKCHDSCESCFGEGPYSCIKCYSYARFLYNHSCEKKCDDGTYPNYDNETGTYSPVCSDCAETCGTCTNGTACLSCDGNGKYRYFDNGHCVVACPADRPAGWSGNTPNVCGGSSPAPSDAGDHKWTVAITVMGCLTIGGLLYYCYRKEKNKKQPLLGEFQRINDM